MATAGPAAETIAFVRANHMVMAVDDLSIVAEDTNLYAAAFVDEPPAREVPQIAFLLRGQKSRIIANWALRVATLPAFRAIPDLPLDQVQRNIDQILDSALIAVATSDPTMDPGPLARAVELAAAHGRERLHDDFTIGDVLSEFHALRHEVWSAIWRELDPEGDSLGLLRELQLRLGVTFDAICVAAAEAWESAREMETTAG